MRCYYASELTVGRARSGEYPFAIEVLVSCDDRRPRGIALEIGSTVDGLAVWKLKIGGEDVPGRFIVVDGRFDLVESESG
jgi:hypothetical protein